MKKLNSTALKLDNRHLEHEGTRSYCGIHRNHAQKQEPVRERKVMPVEGGFREGDYILYNYVDERGGCGKRATAVVTGITKKFLVIDQLVREDLVISSCILLSDIQVGIVLAKKLTTAAYSSDYSYEELDVCRWNDECGKQRRTA